MWNWQQPDWPCFQYDPQALYGLEAQFLKGSGVLTGVLRHLSPVLQQELIVEGFSEEAYKTSEIEGEYLNRDSIQSSLRRHFGLESDHRSIPPREAGLVEMMMDLYRDFQAPLTHEILWDWQLKLMNGRFDLYQVGAYRNHNEPMQVVSGPVGRPKVHFEAPPSVRVLAEMDAFIAWFNESSPGGAKPLPSLIRAGIAHLYFVSIHPFEDGNGRIARTLSLKSVFQNNEAAQLLAFSHVIQKKRKNYYSHLEAANKNTHIQDWLVYFAETLLEAQAYTLQSLEFILQKARFFDRFRSRLNPRQEKVVLRLFEAGIEGFKGGLSTENYLRIAPTSRATATRDLQDLVEMGALTKQGQLKGTRYYLSLKD